MRIENLDRKFEQRRRQRLHAGKPMSRQWFVDADAWLSGAAADVQAQSDIFGTNPVRLPASVYHSPITKVQIVRVRGANMSTSSVCPKHRLVTSTFSHLASYHHLVTALEVVVLLVKTRPEF